MSIEINDLFQKEIIHFGDPSSKLIFIEISDPSCPYCHTFDGNDSVVASQLGKEFVYLSDKGTYEPPLSFIRDLVDKNEAAYVWLYMPSHGNGELGAQVLFSAYAKSKFWQVHDRIMSYEGYKLLNDEVLNENNEENRNKLAEFLKENLDSNDLKEDLKTEKYKSYLEINESVCEQLDISTTPTLIINSEILEGAVSLVDVKAKIEELKI